MSALKEKIVPWVINHKRWIALCACMALIISLAFTMNSPVHKVLSVMGRTKEQPICRVDAQEKVAALTFNITEDVDLEPLLVLLAKTELKATFFVSGKWMELNTEAIKRINEMGHEYGLLGYTGESMIGLDKAQIDENLSKCAGKLYESTGKKTRLFRNAGGEYDNTLIQSVRPKYAAIHYSISVYDYNAEGDIAQIVKKTMDRLRQGSIILLDNSLSSLALYLPIIAENARWQGYEFVFLSEMLLEDGYTDMQGIQRR